MQQDSPDSKTVFTHLSLFFGGPGQDWGRDFMGEANTIVGQLSVTHLLYTVQDLFCAARQPRFQNSFHTPLFVFCWTKSDSIPDQDWGRDCMHEADSFVAQLLVIHLLYTVTRSVQHSKTVQFPKQFSHSFSHFRLQLQVQTVNPKTGCRAPHSPIRKKKMRHG